MQIQIVTREGFLGVIGLLAHREIMCLLGVALGLSSKQIAQQDGCSPASVDKRLVSAACKLNTHKRAHLVAEAMRRGLICISPAGNPFNSDPQRPVRDSSEGVFVA